MKKGTYTSGIIWKMSTDDEQYVNDDPYKPDIGKYRIWKLNSKLYMMKNKYKYKYDFESNVHIHPNSKHHYLRHLNRETRCRATGM